MSVADAAAAAVAGIGISTIALQFTASTSTEDISVLQLQFSSHKIYPLQYVNTPTQPASILSLHLTDGKSILCTSAGPHGFKAKKVCGQLYSDQNPESLHPLFDTALKVMSTPSANEFTFLSPSKNLNPATLTEASAQLVSGQLRLFFGYAH